MEAIDIGLAVDAEAAISEVLGPAADGLDIELPDGLLALPLIVARLPASQRFALVLRLVALILATWFYMDALADERLEVEHVAAALLTNFWLYSALLGAIEHAEEALDESKHNPQESATTPCRGGRVFPFCYHARPGRYHPCKRKPRVCRASRHAQRLR